MESYRKSTDRVEVYLYTGENTEAIVNILDRCGVLYEYLNTAIPFGLDKTYYKRSITFKQDGNTFVLTPGQYLVRDNGNYFSTYTEARFKKLFDKIPGYNEPPF